MLLFFFSTHVVFHLGGTLIEFEINYSKSRINLADFDHGPFAVGAMEWALLLTWPLKREIEITVEKIKSNCVKALVTDRALRSIVFEAKRGLVPRHAKELRPSRLAC